MSAAAVIGVGNTAQGKLPGRGAAEIAVAAALSALEDAGVDKAEIDGLICCRSPRIEQGGDEEVGHLLGIEPRYSATLDYGACLFSLHVAEMAIASGLARTVLLAYGTNQRTRRERFAHALSGTGDWPRLAGLVHIAGPSAMAMRRHMHLYGTTEEQLAWIAVAQREWAGLNPIAIFREPLSVEQFLSMPYLAEPLRRPDLTMISDGGAAIVLTAVDRASSAAQPPVYIRSSAERAALSGYLSGDNIMRPWIAEIAREVYGRAGLGPGDMDIAYLQDATSVSVLQMLEWYGLCPVGEAGPFVASGATRPGGACPVNTNGGQLSEAYMWNWLHVCEAVRQLRGQCGPRQVPGAATALVAQTHAFWKGAATILTRR